MRIAEIEKCIIKILKKRKLDNEIFLGLAEHYCSLLEIIEQLQDHIKEHGVMCDWQNGKNQKGERKNDSIGELNRVSNQALKVLHHLEITPDSITAMLEAEASENEEM